jgi:hypothetical protein
MMRDEIIMERSELRAMTVATWFAASFAGLGVAFLLQRVARFPATLNTACGCSRSRGGLVSTGKVALPFAGPPRFTRSVRHHLVERRGGGNCDPLLRGVKPREYKRARPCGRTEMRFTTTAQRAQRDFFVSFVSLW